MEGNAEQIGLLTGAITIVLFLGVLGYAALEAIWQARRRKDKKREGGA